MGISTLHCRGFLGTAMLSPGVNASMALPTGRLQHILEALSITMKAVPFYVLLYYATLEALYLLPRHSLQINVRFQPRVLCFMEEVL